MSAWLKVIYRDPPRILTKKQWKEIHRWNRVCAKRAARAIDSKGLLIGENFNNEGMVLLRQANSQLRKFIKIRVEGKA